MRDRHDGVPPVRVPDPDADLDQIWHFALSINGYDTADITELSEAEQSMRENWDRGRGLPDELLELRLVLFFLQRQHRHWGSDPDPDTDRYLRAIVAKISEVGGGVVPGPHDYEVFLAKNPDWQASLDGRPQRETPPADVRHRLSAPHGMSPVSQMPSNNGWPAFSTWPRH